MDSLRVFATLVLAVSCFLLVEAWTGRGSDSEGVIPQNTGTNNFNKDEISKPDDLPVVSVPLQSRKDRGTEELIRNEIPGDKVDDGKLVKIKTDLFAITINSIGPEIERIELLEHPSKTNKSESFVIFDKRVGHNYTAQLGLIGEGLPNHKDEFYTPSESYTLLSGTDQLSVTFETEKQGVLIRHHYNFTRNNYVIDILTEIVNNRSQALDPYAYYQLVRDDSNPSGTSKMLPTYTGVALFTEDSKYKKIDFSDIDKGVKKYPKSSDNGWIAIIQHYFLGTWLPEDGKPREYFTRILNNGLYGVGVILPIGNIPSKTSTTVANRLYVGPQDQDKLAALSEGLNLTVDYGFLTIIASPLFRVLKWIHNYVSNWGWSIVFLTVLIKLVFYPLSAASYKSMARMRVVAPKLQKLKELYGDDKQRMQQEMMSLYKTEQINPLGGCLPILVQIPVFISLYWVLLASVELRYAPFVLWIDDLSAKDPYYVLPILMGLSMIIQTSLNPTPPDPVQAKSYENHASCI